MDSVGIVGPGRAGIGLGLALAKQGVTVWIHGRRPRRLPELLVYSWGGWPQWIREAAVILLAVPDGDISAVAAALASETSLRDTQVILHVSGVHDATVLNPLRSTGAALGSLHPLQSFGDPSTSADRLKGAIAAVEGDASAVRAAEELAALIGLRTVRIPTESKALYHAGAVFASNYLVTLITTAKRLFEASGLPGGRAREALRTLASNTLENTLEQDPASALTGPIARGDIDTVQKHLEALAGCDKSLYCAVGLATLEIADLDERTRATMRGLLEDGRLHAI